MPDLWLLLTGRIPARVYCQREHASEASLTSHPIAPPPPAPATPAHQRAGALAALAEGRYRRYVVGLTWYVTGWKVEETAYAWLLWELTHSPLALGALGLVTGLPLVLLQLFGGVLADRMDRLRLLLTTQLVTWLTITSATVLTALGLARIELLLALAGLSAAFRAFEQPARMALIPHLVSPANLGNAIALGSLPWQAGRIVGPALGGVLLASAGGAVGLAFGAASYLLGLLCYLGLKVPRATSAPPTTSLAQQFGEGLVFIAQRPLFLTLITLTFFNSLFGVAYLWVLPAFVATALASGAEGYGLLQAASGAGAILGTVTLASVSHRLTRRGWVMLGGAIAFGGLLLLLAQTRSLPHALMLIPLMGFANTFYFTTVSIVLQHRVPEALRGRVLGIYGLCWNLVPLGGLLVGSLASLTTPATALLVCGALVAGSALALLVLAPSLRRLA
ncbi:MAG: MFS transporter [Dehalococcoidia bacterium]|nr:MAG: MFS transporter [Dehalococcoidia bacterium]